MIWAGAWHEDWGYGEATSRTSLVQTSLALMLRGGGCTWPSSPPGDVSFWSSGKIEPPEESHLSTPTLHPSLPWPCG